MAHDWEVVTAEVPWLDSLLAEELDSLEDSLPLEDVLVDVSELVVGVLELVEALDDWELGAATDLFVERAGSWPEASCT
ncbi:MAG TPA: hypothetical protein VGW98_02990 [Solirubrobacteraceae bacterium]|nr:hypothetical protein [Solirubrobacteraceae bacterium]